MDKMSRNKVEFDAGSPRYECLCGCHVKTLTKVFCFLGLARCIAIAVTGFPFGIIPAIIFGVIYLFALHGMQNGKPDFLLVLLILQAIEILTCIFIFVLYFVIAVFIEKHEAAYILGAYLIIVIELIFAIIWYNIVYRCHEYVSGMKRAKENALPVTI